MDNYAITAHFIQNKINNFSLQLSLAKFSPQLNEVGVLWCTVTVRQLRTPKRKQNSEEKYMALNVQSRDVPANRSFRPSTKCLKG